MIELEIKKVIDKEDELIVTTFVNDLVKYLKFENHEIGRSGKYIVVKRKCSGEIVLIMQSDIRENIVCYTFNGIVRLDF